MKSWVGRAVLLESDACGGDVVMHGAAHACGGTPSVPENFMSYHSQKTSNSQLSFLF